MGSFLKKKLESVDCSENLNTKAPQYTNRLLTRSGAWWKKALSVQTPYAWNLRRLSPGFVLDIGCGIGRNLVNLRGHGVGVDHNPHSVKVAISRGLLAFTTEEFALSQFNTPGRFDTILLAHVAEHMLEQEAVDLLKIYVPLLKSQGQAILISPQEYGFRSEPTHVQFMDFETLRAIANAVGFVTVKEFSFPFQRIFGRVFKYNEFVSVCRRAQ